MTELFVRWISGKNDENWIPVEYQSHIVIYFSLYGDDSLKTKKKEKKPKKKCNCALLYKMNDHFKHVPNIQ